MFFALFSPFWEEKSIAKTNFMYYNNHGLVMHKASLKEAIFRSLLPRPMVFGISPTIPDISYLHKIKKRKLHGVYVPPVAPFSDPALIPDDHTGRRLSGGRVFLLFLEVI